MSNPIPYILVFLVLVIVFLAVLTWSMGIYVKLARCSFEPNIWCRKDWQCKNTCPEGIPNVIPCFKGVVQGKTLPECIYDFITTNISTCQNVTVTDKGGVPCTCPLNVQNNSNSCLSGCVTNINELSQEARANCCCVGSGCGTANPACTTAPQNS